MATGAILMECGRDEIGWKTSTMAIGNRRPNFRADDHQLAVYNRLEPLYRARADSGDNLGTLLHGFTRLAGLINVLVETRGKSCTNPRDKVYALYSLFQGPDAKFPDLDYTKPMERVFCEATAAVFNQDRNHQILYHVSSPSQLPELPSWVPDWSDSWRHQGIYGPHKIFKNYHASRYFRTQRLPTFSEDGTQLALRGR